MVFVKEVEYKVTATYFIDANAKVGNVDFSRDESFPTPSEALSIYRGWQHPGINLSLSRTIRFNRRDHYVSHESPIHESLTIERLEEIVSSSNEGLPAKSYYKEIDFDEARMLCAVTETLTGKPATFSVVY